MRFCIESRVAEQMTLMRNKVETILTPSGQKETVKMAKASKKVKDIKKKMKASKAKISKQEGKLKKLKKALKKA